MMSKRLLLSRALQHSGLLRLIEMLPSHPGILVVNHHRIGDPAATRFDQGVFSDTQDGLDAQIRAIRTLMPIVAGEELEALVTGKTPLTRPHAVITFDDGYLDNYRNAFPVLRSQGVPAIFFPVTEYVGTASVPWWDEIAWLARNTQEKELVVRTPELLRLDVGDDREAVILQLLRHYKKPANREGGSFLAELRESANCSVPNADRRFLNWDEAKEMAAAGMEFGSHTCTHNILSQQTPERQRWELTESKRILERRLGRRIHSLAYPVGAKTAFTTETEKIAAECGFTTSFAFHGGWNRAGSFTGTHLQRISPPMDVGQLRMEMGALLRRNVH